MRLTPELVLQEKTRDIVDIASYRAYHITYIETENDDFQIGIPLYIPSS